MNQEALGSTPLASISLGGCGGRPPDGSGGGRRPLPSTACSTGTTKQFRNPHRHQVSDLTSPLSKREGEQGS